MKKIITFLICLFTIQLAAQQNSFNLQDYVQFMEANKNLTADKLLNDHNAGAFKKEINHDWESALYSDSIKIKFELKPDEIDKIKQHGFVVTERLNYLRYSDALQEIWNKDIPLFITTDMLLHALHFSYTNILKDTESNIILPKLKELLASCINNIAALEEEYKNKPEMMAYLKDIDFYISVPLKFISSDSKPYYAENEVLVNQFINYVMDEKYLETNFLSSVARKIDFSQFKPRGHYTDENYPELKNYFRAMIWLGRMELYLIAPQSLEPPTEEDVQRQTIVAFLFRELINKGDLYNDFEQIESIISAFVGEQDNVTLANLDEIAEELNLSSVKDLADSTIYREFKNLLSTKPFAGQKILSQVLMSDPFSPDKIEPASAFMLFGQRFVIDSYVTGNVVYDKIVFESQKIRRMLPNSLDALFALGNNAAAQLLEPELKKFNYSSNLSALRYLIDSYNQEFWDLSIYNNWLDAIRKLNPKDDRTNLPEFMQTAAWWQKNMNTQLASWIELRHDNLLYAKQSYTGGIVCSYPYGFVEPVPEFYRSLKIYADNFAEKLNNIPEISVPRTLKEYFTLMAGVCDTLEAISIKELNKIEFSEGEKEFIKRTLSISQLCGVTFDGWYPKLYYPYYTDGIMEQDFLVADYHTAPTDEFGNMVGWVKHGGTSEINMMFMSVEIPSGEHIAFAGPVASFKEYTSNNFLRLTDEEWESTYFKLALRPEWTNIYLTDANGLAKPDGPMLLTDVKEDYNRTTIPETYLTIQNYPNPFNPSTIINFSIPQKLTGEFVELNIYSITGELIANLVNEELVSGNYVTLWKGTNSQGKSVSSGVYIYQLKAGAHFVSGKMNLIK
ncbi:MAG: DUF3160 domain-containing protein [Bacteroidetes bacterium]|nr:DUF3160 domain-containing protein [Bacteroidota bacterium]